MISDNIAKNLSVKEPSKELKSLIDKAIETTEKYRSKLYSIWKEVKNVGLKEGFTEEELRAIILPLLPTELTKDQRYYLFHREEQLDRVKENTNNRKLYDNQLLQEIQSLRLQLAQAQEYSIRDLPLIEERIRNKEQDIVDLQKEYRNVLLPKQISLILKWCQDSEIEYNIRKKPIDTILIDIVDTLHSKGFYDIDFALYDSVPDKYRNLSTAEFVKRILRGHYYESD